MAVLFLVMICGAETEPPHGSVNNAQQAAVSAERHHWLGSSAVSHGHMGRSESGPPPRPPDPHHFRLTPARLHPRTGRIFAKGTRQSDLSFHIKLTWDAARMLLFFPPPPEPATAPACDLDGEGGYPLSFIKQNKKPMMSHCMIVGAGCDSTPSHSNCLPGTDGICACREPTGRQTISLVAPRPKLRGEATEWS